MTVTAAERVGFVGEGEDVPEYPQTDLYALHRAGLTGKGIGIAVVDTGIFPHLDFCVPHMRVSAFVDFVHNEPYAYDDNGHGTAVAGIACGGGYFARETCGAAPEAKLVSLKAVDGRGNGNLFAILTAMQWIFTYHKALGIRVVNFSLGSEPMGKRDPLVLGAEALTSVGLVVVASAGNAGPASGTLKSPGISKSAITVGGAEKGSAGWGAADFSSRGGATDGPDLIAPAVNVATCRVGGGFLYMSGTSMAAPLAAGICALILQKHPTYSPARVKQVLLSSLRQLDCPASVCGAGILSPFEDDW